MPRSILPIQSIGVLAESDLSQSARLVAVMLLYHVNRRTGMCYPSLATLASACGVSPTTVKSAIAELRDAGFISWESIVPKNSKSKVNHYNLLFPMWSESDQLTDHIADQSVDQTTDQSVDWSKSGYEPYKPIEPKKPKNTYVEQGALHAPVAAKASTCDCPQQELVAMYHEILPELPRVRVWDGQRAKNMASRWRQWMNAKRQDGSPCYTDRESGLVYWRRFFEYIRESSFLMGNAGKWKASLDWIVKAENMAKIIERKYHDDRI